MLTDAELQGIAAQALNMAKLDMERGKLNFLLASYYEGEIPPLHRMDRIEALIIQRLGENWLNSGRTKDIGFKTLRIAVDLLPPDAVVFVTFNNGFSFGAKFHELPPAQQKEVFNELIRAGHDRHHQAVKEGLLDVCDVLLATVQTPERVCIYQQSLDRRGEFSGKPQTRFMRQQDLGGRLKMFDVPIKFEYKA